jgi:hypothetical protein
MQNLAPTQYKEFRQASLLIPPRAFCMAEPVNIAQTTCSSHIFLVRFQFVPFPPLSKDETFLTLSFGAEDKPNNNNFNNFLSEIRCSIRMSCTLLDEDLD